MRIVLSIIFVALFLIVTAFSLLLAAPMHKTMTFMDLNYEVEEPVQKTQPIKVVEKQSSQTQKSIKTTPKQPQKIIVQVIEEHIKTKPKTVETTGTYVPVSTASIVNEHADIIDKVVKNTEQLHKNKEIKIEQPSNTPTQVRTVDIQNTPLTEEEEIIAWNKWRSDLQNQVMRDANISAPIGTTFYFSCTVDKNGNVSNINTWSANNNYTPLAKRVIKPALASYQRTAILTFPARTKRTVVNVNGQFTMAMMDRFSTPDDYSDYERITR